MEDGLDFQESKQVEHLFLTQEFNRYCPFYMSIGMSYNDYWYGDPSMAKAYLEAYKIKEKRESEKMKWTVWEQGLYVYEAICDVAPVLRAFSKATKPLPYPERPHGLDEDMQKQQNEDLKKKQEELEQYRIQIFFTNWANATKEQFKKNKKKKGG